VKLRVEETVQVEQERRIHIVAQVAAAVD
jgi:hypothetical protein